ncbi:MAG: response regulator [Candidatus Thorarchaeota archaeon]
MLAGEIPFLAALLRMAITEAGFSIAGEATDSLGLIQMCKSVKPHIILVDFDLDEEGAVRLIEEIMDIDMTVAVIVITETLEGFAEKVLAAGAQAFMQKPFSMYDLTDLMRKVVPQIKR